jgi:hypothetical protein
MSEFIVATRLDNAIMFEMCLADGNPPPPADVILPIAWKAGIHMMDLWLTHFPKHFEDLSSIATVVNPLDRPRFAWLRSHFPKFLPEHADEILTRAFFGESVGETPRTLLDFHNAMSGGMWLTDYPEYFAEFVAAHAKDFYWLGHNEFGGVWVYDWFEARYPFFFDNLMDVPAEEFGDGAFNHHSTVEVLEWWKRRERFHPFLLAHAPNALGAYASENAFGRDLMLEYFNWWVAFVYDVFGDTDAMAKIFDEFGEAIKSASK